MQERPDVKLSIGNPVASNLDHGRGNIYAHYLKASLDEFPGPNPASAAQIDDPPIFDPGLIEQIQQAGCRSAGKPAEALVVNVGEIAGVGV